MLDFIGQKQILLSTSTSTQREREREREIVEGLFVLIKAKQTMY